MEEDRKEDATDVAWIEVSDDGMVIRSHFPPIRKS
jgi:hypothetical protein